MKLPQNLLFTKDHEWIRVEGNLATVGVTDHAQEQLGAIVYVELPDEDEEFEQGDVLGAVESTKATADVFSPVSGKVVELNEDLNDNPGAVNTSPYEEGWLVKLELSNPEELEALLNPEDYQKLIDEEA